MDKLDTVSELVDKVREAVQFIRASSSLEPKTGIILGTGLGSLTQEIEVEKSLPYDEIPHFPLSTVESHVGRLLIGHLAGRPVIAMQGRFHLYEGYSPQEVTFPVRVFGVLGIENLIISNAAGGMNPHFAKK